MLEVGAGIGSNTHLLYKEEVKRWVCLEPDTRLAGRISASFSGDDDPSCCELIIGTLRDLSEYDLFDTILYIDVLEHIKDDKSELELALVHLERDGKLIVLSPAHNWLFSRFDEAIGHFRRYDKQMLRKLVPAPYRLLKLEYLDSFGLLISLCNSMILRSGMPTKKQIQIWDSLVVPLSRLVDKTIRFRFGKSILAVWN